MSAAVSRRRDPSACPAARRPSRRSRARCGPAASTRRRGRTGCRRLAAAGFACPVTGFGETRRRSRRTWCGPAEPVGEWRQPLAGDPQRVGVAVQSDQSQAGQLGEEPLGVPAGTEGGVDQHRAGAVGAVPGQRGREQFDAAVEQDGHVAVSSERRASHGKPSEERAPLHRGPCPSARTWRWGSTPGPVRAEATLHGPLAAGSNDVAQCFIAGRGEVLFVGLLGSPATPGRPRSPGSRPSRSPRIPWRGWRSGGGRPTT